MRTPSGVVVDARVMVIPQGVTLANVGPVSYAALLGRLGSKVATFSNRPIELNGGADGYRTEFRWQQRFMELRTVIVSAFKGGKWISIATHHPTNISVAAEIVKTLEFADTK